LPARRTAVPAGFCYGAPCPVAPEFFPHNRCDLWRCADCQRLLLRHTEFGGDSIDHRIREPGSNRDVLG